MMLVEVLEAAVEVIETVLFHVRNPSPSNISHAFHHLPHPTNYNFHFHDPGQTTTENQTDRRVRVRSEWPWGKRLALSSASGQPVEGFPPSFGLQQLALWPWSENWDHHGHHYNYYGPGVFMNC